MKVEINLTRNTAVNVAFSTTALLFGVYSFYKNVKDSDSAGLELGQRPPLYRALAFTTPVSLASALIGAGTWRLVLGRSIDSTTTGIAALTTAYFLPINLVTFGNLDSWRLYDEAETILKTLASTASVATAAALIASGKVLTSEDGPTALTAATVFPAALILFNYKARNGAETDESLLRKALSTTLTAAAITSLANSAKPMLSFQ